jgi:hypothetical protein
LPLRAPIERIDEEEGRVGRPFPAGLRECLRRSNGGVLFVGEEQWTLFPVWDPSSKRTAGRSAGHIARETTALYDGLEGVLEPGLVAIGENGNGDYLMLDATSSPVVWRHEGNELEVVDVEWDRDRPRPRQRSHRAEAVDRVTVALTALGDRPTSSVVIEAPKTGIYVQFVRSAGGYRGESVGERNLTKLKAYHMGAVMRETLPRLGWAEPADPTIDSGNWTRAWPADAWDPSEVARLVVRTFVEAYGLEPWAIAVSVA